jgi:hypothetical protein
VNGECALDPLASHHPAGHEAAHLHFDGRIWNLQGSGGFSLRRPSLPDRIRGELRLGLGDRFGLGDGSLGNRAIGHRIEAGAGHIWKLNGDHAPAVDGCIDVDLNFSPSTNLLAIRRLALEVGQEAEIVAAWLRFPSFTLEPLQQVYLRLSEKTYRYTSNYGKFVAELEVNDAGFVTVYPGFAKPRLLIEETAVPLRRRPAAEDEGILSAKEPRLTAT